MAQLWLKDIDLEMLMKRHPGFQLAKSYETRETEEHRTRLADSVIAREPIPEHIKKTNRPVRSDSD